MAVIYLAYLDGLRLDKEARVLLLISLGLQVKKIKFIEVFAGIGSLSKCVALAGYPTLSLDVAYWEPWLEKRRARTKRLVKTCSGNPMDLLTPAGFALLGLRRYVALLIV